MRAASAAAPLRCACPPAASEAACRTSASSGCMLLCAQGDGGRQAAGDAAERGADAHADAGGVAPAEHVAGHHLAGDEQVLADLATEAHGSGVIGLQAQIGEGDARLERVAEV